MNQKRAAKRKTTYIVGLCAVANFINAADRVIMPITIIPMGQEFHWNIHWQGWILSSFAFGYFTSQVMGACAANKFGCKAVLVGSVLLWSISTSITPLVAHSIPLLILTRILLGLGEGFGLPTMFQILANAVPIEERSRAFSYLISAGSVGQTVASVFCPHLAWQTSFFVFGVCGLVWCLFWLSMYEDQAPRPTPTEDQIPLFVSKSNPTPSGPHWTVFISHWSLWAVYIAHFANNWSTYIIMQWLPTYMSSYLEADSHSLSFTAMPYVMNSLFCIVAGHFADKLISHSWTVLTVRRLMTSIGLIGPAVFLIFFCAVDSLLFAVIFISISMGLSAFNSAGFLSSPADIAPNHAGVTFAVSNTLATIPGMLCGPLTAELVTSSAGHWFPVFILAASINVLGAVVFYSQSSASPIL
uniref:Ascorbate transporter, chloroplastic n=2 Tax=Cacopsylla melanoneura TaxID=428564 RepID=A0A8D8YMG6_9HEMI